MNLGSEPVTSLMEAGQAPSRVGMCGLPTHQLVRVPPSAALVQCTTLGASYTATVGVAHPNFATKAQKGDSSTTLTE